MLRLRRPSTVPPGGKWIWNPEIPNVQPITGGSLTHLLAKVELFKASNGFDLSPGWKELVEGDICRQLNLDSAWCKHVDPSPQQTATIGVQEIGRFLLVLGSWIVEAVQAGEPQWVSQEEAESRAATCAACPYNVNVDVPCAGCADLVAKATSLLGGRKTKLDDKLKSCGICGCDNRASVHVSAKVLAKGVAENHVYPSWCYKKDFLNLKS